MPQSLCSFFGFYDANETVLEMEKQLVRPLELFLSLSAHTVVLSATDMEAEGSTLWGRGLGCPWELTLSLPVSFFLVP